MCGGRTEQWEMKLARDLRRLGGPRYEFLFLVVSRITVGGRRGNLCIGLGVADGKVWRVQREQIIERCQRGTNPISRIVVKSTRRAAFGPCGACRARKVCR